MPAAPAWAPSRRRQDLPVIKTTPGIGPVVILAGLLVLPIALAVTLDGTTYDTWGAYVWAPVLLALAFPLCRWVAKKTGEPEIAGFLFGAAALKIVVGGIARYYMVDAVYGGGDSIGYDTVAGEFAEPFRQGIFQDLGQITGTRFIEIVTGVVQAVIGQTMVGAFLVFAMFGFVGMCLLYLAFCEALPNGDRLLYRRLLFLTPTLWFWPSSIGKEAFLLMCVGATAYGVTRLIGGHPSGVVFGGLGLWGVAVVRPHIALMLIAGMIAAAVPLAKTSRSDAPRDWDDRHPRRRWGLIALPVLLVLVTPTVLSGAEEFLNIEELNLESTVEARDDIVRRTSQGGSEFAPPDTNTVSGFFVGVLTVVARPFLWEATSGPILITALETAALSAVYLVALFRRRSRLIAILRERWVRFSLACVLSFGWGFAVVANFGILARQRSLVLPFVFVLVAAARRPVPSRGASSAVDPVGGVHARL